jgi:hypothetical protein
MLPRRPRVPLSGYTLLFSPRSPAGPRPQPPDCNRVKHRLEKIMPAELQVRSRTPRAAGKSNPWKHVRAIDDLETNGDDPKNIWTRSKLGVGSTGYAGPCRLASS